MAFVTFSDEQDQWGYLYESTFGTANADSANYKLVKFPKGTKIETGVILTDLEHNRSARQPESADIHVDNYEPIRITVSDFVISKDRIADFLYACLQNKVSEGAAANYAKVFKANTSQPDFTANAGYFFTLAYIQPVTGKSSLITSCIVKEFSFKLDKTGTGDQNLGKVSMVILGKKLTQAQTLSGTFVAQGTTYYSAYDFTYNYNDSTAFPWMSFELKIDNGAEMLDRDTDGTPKSWAVKWGSDWCSVDVKHWYGADATGTVVNLLSDRTAGTTRLNSISTSTAVGTDGNLKFSFYGKLKEDPNGSENRQMIAPASYKIVHNSISTNDALIVNIADGIDQTP